MRGVILDGDSLGPQINLDGILGTLQNWTVYPSTSPEETLNRVKEATIVLSNKVVLDQSILSQCSNLKFIGILATGMNNVDLEAAASLKIRVQNVEDYSTESVAQHTMSLILSLAGSLSSYNQGVRSGKWQTSPFFCWYYYYCVYN